MYKGLKIYLIDLSTHACNIIGSPASIFKLSMHSSISFVHDATVFRGYAT